MITSPTPAGPFPPVLFTHSGALLRRTPGSGRPSSWSALSGYPSRSAAMRALS